jgi:DNA-binding CsgD family transcriptional regulator
MSFDTHPDLIVQPYLNGIKLTKPNDLLTPYPSIASLFAMPLMVYFVAFDASYVDANHFIRLTNIPGNQGYYSDRDLKGASFSSIFKRETVQMLSSENNNLLNTRRLTIYEEIDTRRLDDLSFSGISFKFPIFDLKDKIIGVFGFSALTDKVFKEAENIATSMERIIQTGLISSTKNILPGFHINNVYFSKQEIKCLRLLISGKTIRLISEHMSLSPRTVEYYLENIKRKLQIKTKSELIEIVIQNIWPEILA